MYFQTQLSASNMIFKIKNAYTYQLAWPDILNLFLNIQWFLQLPHYLCIEGIHFLNRQGLNRWLKDQLWTYFFNWLTNLDNNNQNGSQKWCQHLMRRHNCLFRTLDGPYILHPVHTCPQIVHRVQLLNSISPDCMDLSHCIQVQDL